MTTTTKPRMRRERGIWLCFSPVYRGFFLAGRVYGFGLTPQDAYESWAGKGVKA